MIYKVVHLKQYIWISILNINIQANGDKRKDVLKKILRFNFFLSVIVMQITEETYWMDTWIYF